MTLASPITAAICLGVVLTASSISRADEPRVDLTLQPDSSLTYGPATPAGSEGRTAATSIGGYFARWFNRVNRAQAEQPHWMAPLVTVTPLLVQQVRYDQFWESLSNGVGLNNYGTCQRL